MRCIRTFFSPSRSETPTFRTRFALESDRFRTKQKVERKVALSEPHNLCGAESSSFRTTEFVLSSAVFTLWWYQLGAARISHRSKLKFRRSLEKTATSSSGQWLPNLGCIPVPRCRKQYASVRNPPLEGNVLFRGIADSTPVYELASYAQAARRRIVSLSLIFLDQRSTGCAKKSRCSSAHHRHRYKLVGHFSVLPLMRF